MEADLDVCDYLPRNCVQYGDRPIVGNPGLRIDDDRNHSIRVITRLRSPPAPVADVDLRAQGDRRVRITSDGNLLNGAAGDVDERHRVASIERDTEGRVVWAHRKAAWL